MTETHLARCVKLAGSLAAGNLLYRALYWQPRAKFTRNNRAGTWIVKSRAEWMQETGLTEKEMRGALAQLKKEKLALVEAHLFGGDHRRVTWLQLTSRAMVLAGVKGQTTNGQKGHATSGPKGLSRNQGVTAELTTSNSFGITSTPYSPPNEEVVPGEDEMKINDIKNKYASSPKKTLTPHSPPSPASPLALAKVWRQANAVYYPGFQPALTQKQLGQLKQIGKQCPEVSSNWVPASLSATVEHWQEFALQVKSNYSLDGVPLVPDIGFVLKYIGEFIKFNLPAPEPSVTKTVVAAPKSPSVQLIAKSPKKATLEEAQAILAEDADDI